MVKHLGDGLMATFASAADAVAAAVAMQQALDLRQPAQRRRAAADAGRHLASATSPSRTTTASGCPWSRPSGWRRRPSRRRSAVAEHGHAPGRGRGRPRVPSARRARAEGPRRAARRVRGGVGAAPTPPTARGELACRRCSPCERAAVLRPRRRVRGARRRLEGVAAGGFAVVLLAGEPGIGKTRLAQELAAPRPRPAAARRARRALRRGRRRPVPAVRRGARLLRPPDPPDELPAALGEFPGDLARLVPDLADLVAGLPDRAATTSPTPSATGCSRPSSRGCRSAAPSDPGCSCSTTCTGPTSRRCCCCATSSPTAPMPDCWSLVHLPRHRRRPHPSAVADARRPPPDAAVTRIAVDGLGDDGVRELLVRTGGHDLDEDGLAVRRAVQRETAGNPFFVGEVLRHLAETGALVERDGRWVSDRASSTRPASPRASERSSAGASAASATMSNERPAVRRGDRLRVRRRPARRRGRTRRRRRARRARHRGGANLVIEVGVDRHRFAHALVRETLHAELSSSRRARQHRKVAEAHRGPPRRRPRCGGHRAGHPLGRGVGRRRSVEGDRARRPCRGPGGRAGRLRERCAMVRAGPRAARRRQRRDHSAVVRRRTPGQDWRGRRSTPASAVRRSSERTRGRRLAIAAGDPDHGDPTPCTISARASFSEGEPADPERVALLREALAMDGLSTLQRPLFGELAIELIMERDIAGRAAALRAPTAARRAPASSRHG